MADRLAPNASEEGTTLAELLVVMLLLSIVGTVTTVGIVRGFNAQLTAQNVAETLDGTRLATQRVRDFVRGADEVCASSTVNSLVLWTDDDDDSAVTPEELDIFELVTNAAGDDVFQRRVPAATGDEVQLIRDDILNNALFEYTAGGGGLVAPADQPSELTCKDGTPVTGGVARIRTVGVTFTVDNPDPTEPDLTTATTVRIRNADLAEAPDTSPVAAFTVTCPSGTQQCSFDASASTDNGSIVSYTWDFGDGNVSGALASPTTTHTYATGDKDYTVTLTVTDNEGDAGTTTATARPGLTSGNAKPVANFTVSCNGRICDFNGSTSTDDGAVVEWIWDFGNGSAVQSRAIPLISYTYGTNGTYGVALRVKDNLGLVSDPIVISVTASTAAMRVSALDVTVTNKTNKFDAVFKVQLGLTTTGTPGTGITVSVNLTGGVIRADSCSTNASGFCTITVRNIPNADGGGNLIVQSLEVTQLNDGNGLYTYDADQDVVDRITVNKNKQTTRYKDGTEVTP